MTVPERTARLMLLYRSALRHSCSWMSSRAHWYEEARGIRHRFEQNRHVTDPAVMDKLLAEGEDELHNHLHPDIYQPAFSHGSSLYGRNPPPPLGTVEMDFGREKGTY